MNFTNIEFKQFNRFGTFLDQTHYVHSKPCSGLTRFGAFRLPQLNGFHLNMLRKIWASFWRRLDFNDL